MSSELDRIRRAYESYDRDERRRARYGLTGPNRAMTAERWAVIGDLLNQAGWESLAGRDVLEIGCGDGGNLDALRGFGAAPDRVTGIDLSLERLAEARGSHAECAFAAADGARLPFPPRTFDAVLLFTVISSILDRHVARRVAAEGLRVLRPGGIVLWYDMRIPNPRNRNVRAIDRRHLTDLFPHSDCWLRSLTVLPPLARALGPATSRLYPLFGAIPLLRSHYAAVIRKPTGGGS